jgi:hypothetical protein
MSLPQQSVYSRRNVNIKNPVVETLETVEDFDTLYTEAMDALEDFVKDVSGATSVATSGGVSLGNATAIRDDCNFLVVLLFEKHCRDDLLNILQRLESELTMYFPVKKFKLTDFKNNEWTLRLNMKRIENEAYCIRVNIAPAFARKDATTSCREAALNAEDTTRLTWDPPNPLHNVGNDFESRHMTDRATVTASSPRRSRASSNTHSCQPCCRCWKKYSGFIFGVTTLIAVIEFIVIIFLSKGISC